MSRLAWLLFLFVASCSSTTQRPTFKTVYGDQVAGTITVTVGNGFLFRGAYHLPRGTRLGLLVDIAKVTLGAKDFRDAFGPVPCQVRSADEKYSATASLEEMKSRKFRDLVLHDGDEVAFTFWNF
ncbi:MAG: hypothetical protein R3F13_02840 [Prosthecobacter sp.]